MANKDPLRTEILRFRILPAEKASFIKAAKIAGLDTADWVRTELRKAAVRDIRSVGEKVEL